MNLPSLIDLPFLDENIEKKLPKENLKDKFFSNRLYLGRMSDSSKYCMRTDLASAIWLYKPEILFWSTEGFEYIYQNYEECGHFLPQVMREKRFLDHLDILIETSKKEVIVVIDSPLNFSNSKELFRLFSKAKKSNSKVYFWVCSSKFNDLFKKNMFFINAFKNHYEEELFKVLPNHKCETITFSLDDQLKCFTSNKIFKFYSYISTEDLREIITLVRWYD